MIAQEYASLARVTLKVLPFRHHMIHMGLGIVGEFGELIDAVKKEYIYGKVVDHINHIEEVGDVLWYVANLLPELSVEAKYMQTALDKGYTRGLQIQQTEKVHEDMNMGEIILSLTEAIAKQAAQLARLNPEEVPGTSFAVQIIENFAGNTGVLCGLLGVDSSMAMERNIAKLKARYGDKFSSEAALNRDLGAERSVLEGQHPLGPNVLAEDVACYGGPKA
jgi:NTP pyrophosphatase (non-canonical NTP hydrolase)